MNLMVAGCNFRETPIEIREKFAFDAKKVELALEWFNSHGNCESVILSTCNRVEIYLSGLTPTQIPSPEMVESFFREFFHVTAEMVRSHFFFLNANEAVNHLFRVSASLDSMILGEAQIAGQVKTAIELASKHATAGPLMHSLFRQARIVAKRVRTETEISKGHVSVSSVAIDFVKQVFDRFDDKTVAILGAGKMGELTLRHLKDLQPKQIIVSNRSMDKSKSLAESCAGVVLPWDQMEDVLYLADIIISTTGAQQPIITREIFKRHRGKREGRPLVILDIAVPRDFDPTIHDGDRVSLFNIDDLQKIRESTLKERTRHIPQADSIVANETGKFISDWARRKNGPVIAKLNQEFENKRKLIVDNLLSRLNGKLDDADKQYIEGAFRLLQNQFLHGPISALAEEIKREANTHQSLLDAIRKLFRLQD